MKRRMMLLIAAMAVLCVGLATAATENATTVVGGTGTYTGITGSAGAATADGGNVTQVDLMSNQSTTRWQGFYGNVSAALRLGLGVDIFYEFSTPNVLAVFASTSNNFDFANMENSSAADVLALNGLWTMGTNVDNATSTYTANNFTDTTLGLDTAGFDLQSGNFSTFVVDDTATAAKGNFAFGGEIQAGGAGGFDGNTWEYELMVPTDLGATETYYFYMSLA